MWAELCHGVTEKGVAANKSCAPRRSVRRSLPQSMSDHIAEFETAFSGQKLNELMKVAILLPPSSFVEIVAAPGLSSSGFSAHPACAHFRTNSSGVGDARAKTLSRSGIRRSPSLERMSIYLIDFDLLTRETLFHNSKYSCSALPSLS